MSSPVAAAEADGATFGVDETDAAHDECGAERRDECRDAHVLGEQAVDEADECRGQQRQEDGRRIGDAEGLHADYGGDARQRHDGALRDIDAGGNEHDRGADRRDGQHR